MYKFTVIEKGTSSERQFRNLKEVSSAYNIPYALTCRIYRKDFKGKKNHRSIQMLLDSIEIVDFNPFRRDEQQGTESAQK